MITVSINRTGGTAQVGQIVLGEVQDIGVLETQPEIDKQSFSRYTEDEFGNISVTRRLPAKITRMTVFKKSSNVRFTEQILDRALDTFTVYVGTERSEAGLILFGVLRSAPIVIEVRNAHRMQLEIRSLI